MLSFMFLFYVLALSKNCNCSDEEFEHSALPYIISCHSTDFICFQNQYEFLRDNVLLGCQELDVPSYKHYYFQYSDTKTCVKVSGVEASKLVGVSGNQNFESRNKVQSIAALALTTLRHFIINLNSPVITLAAVPFKEEHSNVYTLVLGGRVSDLDINNKHIESFDGTNHLLTMTITTPVRFQQVWPTWSAPCEKPEKEFVSKGPHVGPYRKFAGNATMAVQYSFELEKKNNKLYMTIDNEDLDVTLDVPDLSSYNRSSVLESRIYEWSEWAYDMVQHVDVPEHTMVPYLRQIRAVYSKLPLERLIVLYPREKYQELRFKYIESNVVDQY